MTDKRLVDNEGGSFVKGAFYEHTDRTCAPLYRFYRATEVKRDRVNIRRIVDGRIFELTDPPNCRNYAVRSRAAMEMHLMEFEEAVGNIRVELKLSASPKQ